jgi:hypothetical protein
MSITANQGRSLYSQGTPLPGEVVRHDPGELIIAGQAGGAIPFGRIVGQFVLATDGIKTYEPIDETSTKAGGASVYSTDAITDPEALEYAEDEACGVMERGFVVLETYEGLALDNTALTVVNGEGTTSDADDVGKISQQTGEGFSVVTNLRLVRKFSDALAEFHITGPIALTPGN